MEKSFVGPQISETTCRKIITNKLKNFNFTITNYQQIPFDEINGYLGEHCTLRITIKRNTLEEVFTFFVKFPPQVQTQRKFLDDINGLVKEKNFFTKYVPLLREHGVDVLEGAIPECFLAEEDVFIFEDMKARGYETISPRSPLKLNYAKAALKSLAKLHVSGLILEEVKNYRLTEEFEIELREGFYKGTDFTDKALGSCKQAIGALIDISHEATTKISKEFFKSKAFESCDLIKEFVKPTPRFRNTLCHADVWSKNFLFKNEGGDIECVIVDFQSYRYGAPGHDVLSFIHMVTDRQLRTHHLTDLLHFYFNELRINLDKFGYQGVVTKEEFFESLEYYQEFALIDTLSHFQVVLLSDELANELFRNPENAQSLFDDRSSFFKLACSRDIIFKKRNFEAIADLRDFYERQLIFHGDNNPV